jgi:hypothetical protein
MAVYYNTNILYIESFVANEENITNSLHIAVQNIEKILNRTIHFSYKINIIRVRDKDKLTLKSIGYGYIWISDPEIYWILAGHNPDGSERFDEYPDPNWTSDKGSNEVGTDDEIWADIIENEIALHAPILRVQKPPLVTFPGYKLTEEQMIEMKERADEFGIDPSNIEEMGHFNIRRSTCDPVPLGKIGNILYSKNVPQWIPNDVFKNIFSRYVTDKKTKMESKDKKVYQNVPIINRLRESVYIIYDPNTRDASFARMMQRKTRIQNPNNPSEKCEIIFDYTPDTFKTNYQVVKSNEKGISTNLSKDSKIGKKCLYNGYDFIICDINVDLIQIKNERTCEIKWVKSKNVEIY